MPNIYSSKHIIKILEEHGFRKISQRGSHAKYMKYGSSTLTAIVPVDKKEIPFGTFKSICRQSALSTSDFKK